MPPITDLPAKAAEALEARLTLIALRSKSKVTVRAIRFWWALSGHGAERDLLLARCRPRWRLMVAEPRGEPVQWHRNINGRDIPIVTRKGGKRRLADFLRTHPGDSAWLERVQPDHKPEGEG